jgi:hypothetical protein
MTIKIGTIQEMTGNGFEILVDSETRSFVLAKFFNGHMVGTADADLSANVHGHGHEKTIAASN